jgi:hypothetical protein
MTNDHLERKLQLYLGSQSDWIEIYSSWCTDKAVSATEAHEHHNVSLFVREMKMAERPAKIAPPTLLRGQG